MAAIWAQLSLPSLPVSFFLWASPEVRVQRRYRQIGSSYEKVSKELAERDLRDATRSFAPAEVAQDAFIVDTSHASVEEIEKNLLSIVRFKLGGGQFKG